MDVIYAVDTSSGVSDDVLQKMKSFLRNSLKSYTISPTETHIGLMQYGNGAMVKLSLKYGFTESSFVNSVSELELTGGPRQMQKAIRKVASVMFTASDGSRSGSSKVLILLTTGKNYPAGKSDLPKAAKKLKEKGVKVIVVKIGNENNPDATDIVNNPDKIIKSDPDKLNEAIGEIEKEIGKSLGTFFVFVNQTFCLMFLDCLFCITIDY